MKFSFFIISKRETEDIYCRRRGKFDVIEEVGIVVRKVVSS